MMISPTGYAKLISDPGIAAAGQFVWLERIGLGRSSTGNGRKPRRNLVPPPFLYSGKFSPLQ
jgi:hypothetical protein